MSSKKKTTAYKIGMAAGSLAAGTLLYWLHHLVS